MLQVTIPEREWYDPSTREFYEIKETTLKMEHSLLSISKWESKWKKGYFNTLEPRTVEEDLDYYRCMTINSSVDPLVFFAMPKSVRKQIDEYIENPQTASYLESKRQEGASPFRKNFITSESIYCWMTQLNIPFECEKWPFSRLMALIQACQDNSPNSTKQNKMSTKELMTRNTDLNKLRRAQRNSKG